MANNYHCPRCGTREVTEHKQKDYIECNKCGHVGKPHRFAYKYYDPKNRKPIYGIGAYRREPIIEDPEGSEQ